MLGLLNGLRDRGFDPKLALFSDGELASLARRDGFDPVIFPGSNRDLLRTSRHLGRWFEKENVDVVHVHGYKAMVFCAAARTWRKVRIVKTEHGLQESFAGRPIATLREGAYRVMDAIATQWTRASICYVTCDLRRRYMRRHMSLVRTVIPNGLGGPDQSAVLRPADLPDGQFNVAVVGRLELVKGHRFAIEALASMVEETDVNLYCVGSGPCENDLRALSADLCVAHRIHFMGFRRDAYAFIANCDVILICSLHEGLPYVLLEAMALGAPVIASRVGGLMEVLEHERTGLLVPPGDAEALSRAVRRLRGDPQFRARLGVNGKEVWKRNYTLAAMTESYERLYRQGQPINGFYE